MTARTLARLLNALPSNQQDLPVWAHFAVGYFEVEGIAVGRAGIVKQPEPVVLLAPGFEVHPLDHVVHAVKLADLARGEDTR